MKKILLILILLAASILTNAQATTLRIDPSSARGGTVSQLFDEVNFIPLETIKESLFGRIDQLEVTDKYFVILDDNTNSILIFDKTGKFHAKIKGPNNADYTNPIGAFRIVPSKNLIECHQISSTQTKLYSFDGKKIGEKKVPFNFLDFYHFQSGAIAYYNSFFPTEDENDSLLNEVWLAKNDSVYQRFLPFNVKKANLASGEIILSPHLTYLYPSENDASAFFLRPYDYTIYELTPHTLLPKFSIILPLVNSLPNNFIADSVYNGKRLDFFMKNNNIVYNLANTYLLNDNLFFKLVSFGGLEHNNSFMYNLTSGALKGISHILPDSSSYYLPVTDDGAGSDFHINNFLDCDGKYIYTSYSSLVMFAMKTATADKNINYPPVLQNYFKTENRRSNPVIVQLKPKHKL